VSRASSAKKGNLRSVGGSDRNNLRDINAIVANFLWLVTLVLCVKRQVGIDLAKSLERIEDKGSRGIQEMFGCRKLEPNSECNKRSLLCTGMGVSE